MEGTGYEWRCELDEEEPLEWLWGVEGRVIYWRTDPGDFTTAVMVTPAHELVQIELGRGRRLRRIERPAACWGANDEPAQRLQGGEIGEAAIWPTDVLGSRVDPLWLAVALRPGAPEGDEIYPVASETKQA